MHQGLYPTIDGPWAGERDYVLNTYQLCMYDVFNAWYVLLYMKKFVYDNSRESVRFEGGTVQYYPG